MSFPGSGIRARTDPDVSSTPAHEFSPESFGAVHTYIADGSLSRLPELTLIANSMFSTERAS